ncbi:MAG: response regulator [Candidatus Omnitrophica bacterium]|nr:response regulator [Candidatus Omnitrophota bacterium]
MEKKNIRVLVVEDEVDFKHLLTFWLESKGYDVEVAQNGKEAVEMVRAKPAHIVFMDLRMPVMDGTEAIKNIREFNKDIPIIVISAYVGDPKAKEANAYGISGVFYKGTDFEEGLSLLEVALKTHRQLKKQSQEQSE